MCMNKRRYCIGIYISVGNIILMDEGGSLLIDWKLVKMLDNNKSR